jgi:hypothetical protein
MRRLHMRTTAAITTGLAVTVLGAGLAFGLGGGGNASATKTGETVTSAVRPSSSPTASPSADGTKISRSEAERIALRAVPGGRVHSAELEPEHGALVWNVHVTARGVEHDVNIDARTGDVRRDQAMRGEDATSHREDRVRHGRDDSGHRDDRGGHGKDDSGHPEDRVR